MMLFNLLLTPEGKILMLMKKVTSAMDVVNLKDHMIIAFVKRGK